MMGDLGRGCFYLINNCQTVLYSPLRAFELVLDPINDLAGCSPLMRRFATLYEDDKVSICLARDTNLSPEGSQGAMQQFGASVVSGLLTAIYFNHNCFVSLEGTLWLASNS